MCTAIVLLIKVSPVHTIYAGGICKRWGAFHSSLRFRNFGWRMEQHFPEFPKKRTIRKFLTRNFRSIWLSSRNLRNFRLSGSLFGNWTISKFSGNFPRKFPYNFARFRNFREFLLNGKRPEVSLWKRIKCSPCTLRRRNLTTQQSPVVLNLHLRKILSGKSHDYRDVIVFEKLRFQNGYRPHENGWPAFSGAFSWRISVHSRLNRRNKAAFSNFSGVMWMLPWTP